MKKYFVLALILSVASILTGCVSSTVERVDFDSQQDLSGYWNDTDARIVSNDLAEQLTDSSWYNRFIQENDRKPVIIIGSICNNTDEHINTSIISKKLEISLINTGKVLSVANSSERKEISGGFVADVFCTINAGVNLLVITLVSDFFSF